MGSSSLVATRSKYIINYFNKVFSTTNLKNMGRSVVTISSHSTIICTTHTSQTSKHTHKIPLRLIFFSIVSQPAKISTLVQPKKIALRSRGLPPIFAWLIQMIHSCLEGCLIGRWKMVDYSECFHLVAAPPSSSGWVSKTRHAVQLVYPI